VGGAIIILVGMFVIGPIGLFAVGTIWSALFGWLEVDAAEHRAEVPDSVSS